mmetsp:Transcript_5604/g.8878  ORF Transcript_5604/g.8878 Transcript_5604/m.8878 type:complete len:110 (+) Transcript_5604:1761-2090(+)
MGQRRTSPDTNHDGGLVVLNELTQQSVVPLQYLLDFQQSVLGGFERGARTGGQRAEDDGDRPVLRQQIGLRMVVIMQHIGRYVGTNARIGRGRLVDGRVEARCLAAVGG